MIRQFKIAALPLVILIFILGDAYVLVNKKDLFYIYNLIPVFAIIGYTAIFHLQKLVLFLAFCTPLAITLKELGLSNALDLSLPTEPLMAGIMLLYILNQLYSKITDKNFVIHPITVIITIQLFWMLITTLTSTEIIISLKYLLSRLWFIFSCYVIIPHLFNDKNNIYRFVFLYAIALAIVVGITIIKHAAYNFDDKTADWVVSPFYNDHTAYGAALAMFIPILIAFVFIKTLPRFWRMFALSLALWFVLGIILSFARAGWLSLILAMGIGITLILKIKFRAILFTLIAVSVLFFTFKTEIFMALGRNNTDAEGSFSNNIESVSNISTDASNLERINRWSCAYRMWLDKPLLGFGPGTYMFKYAPYQLSREQTIISTNFGTNGNAHSEYLGPLSEQGLPGLLIVLALLFYATGLGYRLVYTVKNTEVKIITIGVFLGLITYFVHGFLNNFLDTDKLSVPFWGFLAALVSIDLYLKNGPKNGHPIKSSHPEPST
jgi:putative inorganic carbon (hco3(-)) transporter